MKESAGVLAVALAAVMLLVLAVVPVIADCPSGSIPEWDGGGGDNLWTTEGNWVDDFEPDFDDTSACLHLDGGDNICEYGTYLGNHAWHITIFGEYPTLFTFNVAKDICPGSFDLQEYSSLDVDDCVDAGNTELSGRITIDVAGGVDCCLGFADVEDESASLELTGQIKFEDLEINAETASQNITLTLDDGGTLLADRMEIRAETRPGWTARSAGLKLDDGTITANELDVWGGQANDRRVAFDLDDSMTVRNKTTMDILDTPGSAGGGRVFIDVLVGVTLDLGELYIGGPSIVKVSGIGLNDVFGQVVTSANEGASDNTCTCSCS